MPHHAAGLKLVNLVSDFLKIRAFKVGVGRFLSREDRVLTKCRQETVMGSLLFMIFVNQVKLVVAPPYVQQSTPMIPSYKRQSAIKMRNCCCSPW